MLPMPWAPDQVALRRSACGSSYRPVHLPSPARAYIPVAEDLWKKDEDPAVRPYLYPLREGYSSVVREFFMEVIPPPRGPHRPKPKSGMLV